ncbi:hypothetical protein SB11R_19475 [Pseudomonas oryzihabitans]|nr:hypothetical protein SB11R_19475 [Pseudomonas psychrotolerans]
MPDARVGSAIFPKCRTFHHNDQGRGDSKAQGAMEAMLKERTDIRRSLGKMPVLGDFSYRA